MSRTHTVTNKPREILPNGRVRFWILGGIVNCRVIPGYRAVDPLTLPLLDRPSARRNAEKLRDRAEAACRETSWSDWTGSEAESERRAAAASRWTDFAFRNGLRAR